MDNRLESDNIALKKRVAELEAELSTYRSGAAGHTVLAPSSSNANSGTELSLEEYKRYGRQMILPEIGYSGQLSLKRSKVLLVGAGGLGCPAAAYLAGSGVGTLGIIDHDIVESSNLHRQIIHSTPKVGVSKVTSAISYLRDLNPHPTYVPHIESLRSDNVFSIMAGYDLVLDCTDHPAIRYLINDAAVLHRIPIVSASALRMEGQLIVLNNPPSSGPCYRCIWPIPPPAASVVGCGEGGILGPVVGLMGTLQAIEAIKVLASYTADTRETAMTLFSAYSNPQFRMLKMRGKKVGCVSCGSPENQEDKITWESIESGRTDHVAFCGSLGAIDLLKPEERVGVKEYKRVVDDGRDHILLDVRDKTQFGICRLEGSLNVPYSEFEALKYSDSETEGLELILQDQPKDREVYVICRLGNDSQIVTKQLKESGIFPHGQIFDIKGGITEWARSGVAGEFPEY